MLRPVVTYLLVWLTLPLAFAQPKSVNPPARAKIDSLQRLLTNAPTRDSLHIIRLQALARLCFVDLQFTRGLLATRQAQDLAKQLHYPNGKGLYWQTLAAFSYTNTNSLWFYYDYWFGLAAGQQSLAPPFKTNPDTPPGYPLPLDYADLNRRLETALAYFTTHPDAEMSALILSFISANYRSLHQLDKSLAYLDRAIQAFQQARQPGAAFYLLAHKTRLLQAPQQVPQAQHAARLVNQFLTQQANRREAAPIAYQLSWYYVTTSQLVRSFALSTNTNASLERLGDEHLRPLVLENLGYIYLVLKAPRKALAYFKQAARLLEKTNNYSKLAWMDNKIAFTLMALKRFEEANAYITKNKLIQDTKPASLGPNVDLAKYYEATGQRLMGLGQYQQALAPFVKAIQIDRLPGGDGLDFYLNLYLAQCYQRLGNVPASVDYGKKSYHKAVLDNSSDGREITLQASQLLVENYQRLGQPLAAYPYLKTYYSVHQAIDDQNAVNRLADMEIQTLVERAEQDKDRLERARLRQQKENQQQRWWLLSSGAALVGAFTLLGLLYRNNQQQEQANTLLTHQKQELDRQRAKAEQALRDLKATQNQLIQQEKLASLGELTAGIAHEMQNPLNLVTNFSQVSTGLVDKLEAELGEADASAAKALMGTLRQNLHKIYRHSGRASSIVRGMLEHSRTDLGEKRPIDLNALAQEYLTLAYHSFKAKDATFTCKLVTHFDPTTGQVTLLPQGIGRVLLNLFSNAFYAVWARHQQGESAYQPTVAVTTVKTLEGVEIRVSDNGIGISESHQVKVFQPFFTTKPAGEGTGLGLSLSYDIITKGHGGSLTVESQAGEGTEFVIQIPALSEGTGS